MTRRYNPNDLPAQHPVPGQNPPLPPPFVPRTQPDMITQRDFRDGQLPNAIAREAAPFVVTQYDGRPINGVDFNFRLAQRAVNTAVDASTELNQYFYEYEVPQKWIAVLRGLTVMLRANDGVSGPLDDPAAMNITMDADILSFTLSVQINGATVAGMENIDIWPATMESVDLECYVVANPGDVISAQIYVLTDIDASAAWVVSSSAVYFYGNFMPATGIQAEQAVGTLDPVPVAVASSVTMPQNTTPREQATVPQSAPPVSPRPQMNFVRHMQGKPFK